MNRDRYALRVTVDADFETTDKRVREALRDEGFGVLTEIDVRETLREKLDVDHPPYRILGACNPPLAHQALETDEAIGGLLPCNVVVRALPEGGTEIIAVDPERMLGFADVPGLDAVAEEAAERIERAVRAAAG
jgi:uncharacterized protein (DUF302 family)